MSEWLRRRSEDNRELQSIAFRNSINLVYSKHHVTEKHMRYIPEEHLSVNRGMFLILLFRWDMKVHESPECWSFISEEYDASRTNDFARRMIEALKKAQKNPTPKDFRRWYYAGKGFIV